MVFYPPVGRCIYCGKDRYDREKRKLSEEHIVPLAINGDLILPEASCRRCAKITHKAEESILWISAKGYRTQIGYKSRRKRPKEILIRDVNGTGRCILIPADDYPQVFGLMIWPRPRLLSGRSADDVPPMDKIWIDLESHQAAMARLNQRGIYSFKPPEIHNQMIFRMIAKIAHAFLVAKIGLGNFKPLLTDFILEQKGDILYLIGGTEESEYPTDKPYQLSHAINTINGKEYYVVSVRIFADKMAPTYLAVTGEVIA